MKKNLDVIKEEADNCKKNQIYDNFFYPLLKVINILVILSSSNLIFYKTKINIDKVT